MYKREFINKKNNKKIPLKSFSIQTKFYKDYVFYKMFCKHLEQLAMDKGLEVYFLTLTKKFKDSNYIQKDKKFFRYISVFVKKYYN